MENIKDDGQKQKHEMEKSDHEYIKDHEYTFGADCFWDGASRDFTFNAVFVDVVGGYVLDPCYCLQSPNPGFIIDTAISAVGSLDSMFVYSYTDKKAWALPWKSIFFLLMISCNCIAKKTFAKDYGCDFRFFKEWFKSNVLASPQAAKKVLRQLSIASSRFFQGNVRRGNSKEFGAVDGQIR
eukprot:TRINITY_DN187_c0_g1_i1.p1 TRINITY_DN187_c0_g1~~TRINITY_DN187_c0_g1_i1.p1  ORF type:complete len:182 (-),score=48.46 TRINITY_DN187_c0_g1_i1:403-948(-)